jgi:hypothetical protein
MQTFRLVSGRTYQLLGNAGFTATGAGAAHYKDSPHTTFHATVVGTGAVTATVVIEGSNDQSGTGGAPQYWAKTALATINLTGTGSDSDGVTVSSAPWKYIRARVTALTGTGATVNCIMGC